jgi:hypothetical protein
VDGGSGAERSVTRASWLRRALAIGAGLGSGGILAGGFAHLASSSPSHRRDVAILNFALAFEELQAAFYADALRTGRLHGDWRRFAEVVGAHEHAHVAFLRRALGAAARPAPTLELGAAARDPARFPHVAIALEDAGVALYNGQGANLTPASLAAAAKIVSVEARHAAWARDLARENPAPEATDPGAGQAQVEAALGRAGVRRKS